MNLDQFIERSRSDVEVERSNRIHLAVAAYAYEFENDPIMTDGEFDELAKKIRPEQTTIDSTVYPDIVERYTALDKFFKTEFSPDTGQWIHKHPELDRVARVYERFWKK